MKENYEKTLFNQSLNHAIMNFKRSYLHTEEIKRRIYY